MKYLKMFNESTNEDEFRDFCDYCLACLIDNGYHQFVEDFGTTYKIFIERRVISNGFPVIKKFEWNDVKNEIIPFIELLSSRYKIDSIFMMRHGKGYVKQFTVDGILDDNINENDVKDLNRVVIYVYK